MKVVFENAVSRIPSFIGSWSWNWLFQYISLCYGHLFSLLNISSQWSSFSFATEWYQFISLKLKKEKRYVICLRSTTFRYVRLIASWGMCTCNLDLNAWLSCVLICILFVPMIWPAQVERAKVIWSCFNILVLFSLASSSNWLSLQSSNEIWIIHWSSLCVQLGFEVSQLLGIK